MPSASAWKILPLDTHPLPKETICCCEDLSADMRILCTSGMETTSVRVCNLCQPDMTSFRPGMFSRISELLAGAPHRRLLSELGLF